MSDEHWATVVGCPACAEKNAEIAQLTKQLDFITKLSDTQHAITQEAIGGMTKAEAQVTRLRKALAKEAACQCRPCSLYEGPGAYSQVYERVPTRGSDGKFYHARRDKAYEDNKQCRRTTKLTRTQITIYRAPHFIAKLPERAVILLCPSHLRLNAVEKLVLTGLKNPPSAHATDERRNLTPEAEHEE